MENKIVFDEKSFQRIEKKAKNLGAVYHRNPLKEAIKEIKSNPLAVFAVIYLTVIIVACLLAPLSPYDPNALNLSDKFAEPSLQHFFGCDEFGRDYFTRALYGGRVSLLVGFSAMMVTVCIGTTIGIFSGYIGGKLDMLLMRFTDISVIDPVMSIGVAVFIIVNAARTLASALDVFLEKAPREIDVHELEHHVSGLDGVRGVHHIHVWSMDGVHSYATMHVVTDYAPAEVKRRVRDKLAEHGIHHATIEIEAEGEECGEENCSVNFDSHSHHYGHHHEHHHHHGNHHH